MVARFNLMNSANWFPLMLRALPVSAFCLLCFSSHGLQLRSRESRVSSCISSDLESGLGSQRLGLGKGFFQSLPLGNPPRLVNCKWINGFRKVVETKGSYPAQVTKGLAQPCMAKPLEQTLKFEDEQPWQQQAPGSKRNTREGFVSSRPPPPTPPVARRSKTAIWFLILCALAIFLGGWARKTS